MPLRTVWSLILARSLSGDMLPSLARTLQTPYTAEPWSLTTYSPVGGSRVDSKLVVARVGKHFTRYAQRVATASVVDFSTGVGVGLGADVEVGLGVGVGVGVGGGVNVGVGAKRF